MRLFVPAPESRAGSTCSAPLPDPLFHPAGAHRSSPAPRDLAPTRPADRRWPYLTCPWLPVSRWPTRPRRLLYPALCRAKDLPPQLESGLGFWRSARQGIAPAGLRLGAVHRRGSWSHFHLDSSAAGQLPEARPWTVVHQQQPRWMLVLQPWLACCPPPLNWRGQKWAVVLV